MWIFLSIVTLNYLDFGVDLRLFIKNQWYIDVDFIYLVIFTFKTSIFFILDIFKQTLEHGLFQTTINGL